MALTAPTVAVLASAPKNTGHDNVSLLADRAKARNIVETASGLIEENILLGKRMFDKALDLAPDDSVVRMAYNNVELALAPKGNPLYYPQLELLEATPDAPVLYYFTLTRATSPEAFTTDTMAWYETAVKALRRFPTNAIFIDHLLNTGIEYLYSRRYVHIDKEKTDTLELSAPSLDLAQKLLDWGDTIEAKNGYVLAVDKSRAAIYELLERREDLTALGHRLEQRDSTDADILDLVTAIAYVNHDTLKMSELGMRRFDLMPEPDHVFSLYEAMAADTMRTNFAERVVKTSLNTDLDPDLRFALMQALAQAFYKDFDEESEKQQELPDQISAALTEMCAEDPYEITPYIRSTFLTKADHWARNYGYRHWLEALETVPDSIEQLFAMQSLLVLTMPENADFEKGLAKYSEIVAKGRPDMVLNNDIAKAQYYYNNKNFRKAIELLGPVTLEKVRTYNALSREYYKEHPQGEVNNEAEDDEKAELKQWMAIQSLLSQCFMETDEVDKALAILNHIIVLDPENSEALNNLAYYMCENGRDLSVALSLVDRALALTPDNFNAIDTRAWILFKKGDVAGALADFKNLFGQLGIDIQKDFVEAENAGQVLDTLRRHTNISVVGPFLGHIISVLEADAEVPREQIDILLEALREVDPENEDLLRITSHKK